MKDKKITKKKIPLISMEELRRLAENNPEMAEALHALDVSHHKFRNKQRSYEAMKIRRSLRRKGIFLSHIGHTGGEHD